MYPSKQAMKVVLPAPFGPIRPKASPGLIERQKSLRAVTYPALCFRRTNPSTTLNQPARYLLVRFFTSMPKCKASVGISSRSRATPFRDRQYSSHEREYARGKLAGCHFEI